MAASIRNLGAAVAWLICSAAMAHAETPTVVSAIVNSATQQIAITGTSLTLATGAPVVKLDATTLTLVSSSSTQIVADSPAGLAAGTYRLTVSNGSATPGVFYMANGALTLPFNGSAWGSSGPIFDITNTSSAHSAISGHGGGGTPYSTGGTGTSGYGGASNGSSSQSTFGGTGIYAFGGTGTGDGDFAGYGVSAYGGPGTGSSAQGGGGISATGGNGPYVGGDGVDAFGGNGAHVAGLGIYARAGSGSTEPFAGLFQGDVSVEGNLSKSAGSFKIDHPLDPANKYLYHSFVESPDMMNIYNGNVVTDGSGAAIVTMPSWFEALNTDFRYQLTVIGQFAQAIVASKVANRSFTIKTNKPGVEVSWQVTGIRQDTWANAHRIPVEVDKAPQEQGHYIHPELFGYAGEPSIAEMRHPRPQPPQQ